MEGILALRSLLWLVVVALALLLALNFVSATGGIGGRVSGALSGTGQALSAAKQTIGDLFNPTHPPRYAISQDTELSSLMTIGPGQDVGQSRQYVFRLSAIHVRDNAGSSAFADYAVLDRQYITPKTTSLFGITLRVDRGQRQYVLDRGETFRIGQVLYKVNWISASQNRMALGTYRYPDRFAGKLAFQAS